MTQVNVPFVTGIDGVSRDTGLCRTLIYEALGSGPGADPTFPRPIRVSARRKVWLTREVHDWVLAKAALRKNEDAS